MGLSDNKFRKGFVLKVAFFQKVLMALSFPQTNEPFIFLNLKIWILEVFKAALTSQARSSCYQTWRNPHFLGKFQSRKFKFSSSGKWMVHMFEEMTNASALSEKKLRLQTKK